VGGPKNKFMQRVEFEKAFRERKKILQLHGMYKNYIEKIHAKRLLHRNNFDKAAFELKTFCKENFPFPPL
jgi:hypothetical protein